MHLKPEELGRGHYHLWGDPEPDLVLWALDQSPRLVHQQGFEESIIDTPSRCTNGHVKAGWLSRGLLAGSSRSQDLNRGLAGSKPRSFDILALAGWAAFRS